MTGKPEKPPGRGAKTVKRQLADGSVKVYSYPKKERRPQKPMGALRMIFNAYSVSPEFKRSVPEWQKRKLWLFNLIEKELGWMTRDDLEDRGARTEFYALRDKYADLPHRADKMIQSLAAALQWAYERATIGVNHAARIEALINPKLSPHRYKRYTDEQEDLILTSAPDDLRRAYLFALYTGLRRGDCIRAKWADVQDGWLVITPSKTSKTTGAMVTLPINELPPLRDLMAEMPRVSHFILTTETEIPWSEFNLSIRWRKFAHRLGMQGMRFHDIRHTTQTRLVEAGCTEAERGAITGQALAVGSGAVYVARTRQLSVNAYRRWHRWIEGGGEVVQLENVARKRPGVAG